MTLIFFRTSFSDTYVIGNDRGPLDVKTDEYFVKNQKI